MEPTITIPKSEYLNLKIAELKIDMLEAGGVDNWNYYLDELYLDGKKSFCDLKEKLKKEILGDSI